MANTNRSHISALIEDVRCGKDGAVDDLMAVVYPELREIAAHYLRSERSDHTLQATALANETYLRLFGSRRVEWKTRAHFFAVVATEMRRILVDYARSRNSKKRSGLRMTFALQLNSEFATRPDEDLLAVDEALARLEKLEPRASRVVELRFFTGLDEREAAEALGVSISTLKRDWQFAKTWLFKELGGNEQQVNVTNPARP
jgi:RNA polymerase sigma factor (TIGR02999 family)